MISWLTGWFPDAHLPVGALVARVIEELANVDQWRWRSIWLPPYCFDALSTEKPQGCDPRLQPRIIVIDRSNLDFSYFFTGFFSDCRILIDGNNPATGRLNRREERLIEEAYQRTKAAIIARSRGQDYLQALARLERRP
jgi:hypothetical protein